MSPPASSASAALPTSSAAAATARSSSSSRETAPSASSASSAPAEPPRHGAAYFGCGVAIPSAHLWDESTEAEVFEAISAAKACARAEHRQLLLEFVAPWCADCREMAKLDESVVVIEALRARYERVRINVGKWDRHEALRESFGVRALATYIVLDPATSKPLARTTLEPITRRTGKKLTAEDWASWLRAQPTSSVPSPRILEEVPSAH